MCAALLLSLRLEQRAHTESPIQTLEEEEDEEGGGGGGEGGGGR